MFYECVKFEGWLVKKNFRNSVEWINGFAKPKVSVGFSYRILCRFSVSLTPQTPTEYLESVRHRELQGVCEKQNIYK